VTVSVISGRDGESAADLLISLHGGLGTGDCSRPPQLNLFGRDLRGAILTPARRIRERYSHRKSHGHSRSAPALIRLSKWRWRGTKLNRTEGWPYDSQRPRCVSCTEVGYSEVIELLKKNLLEVLAGAVLKQTASSCPLSQPISAY
jgi:hypothetical protein